VEDHRSPAVDFVTCHLWAQNWGWVDAACGTKEFERALQLARDYVERHAAMAARLAKPILLEEFGFPRDAGSFDPAAPTTFRDRYFEAMYALVASLALETPMLGIFPWAWSGSSRPRRPGGAWRPGDPLTGDPPHEPQGWYGIYESDSTIEVIRDGCAALGLRA
jgi:mannan endo-1,4-beta-mannosidase